MIGESAKRFQTPKPPLMHTKQSQHGNLKPEGSPVLALMAGYMYGIEIIRRPD
jgi:hypothetical protein